MLIFIVPVIGVVVIVAYLAIKQHAEDKRKGPPDPPDDDPPVFMIGFRR